MTTGLALIGLVFIAALLVFFNRKKTLRNCSLSELALELRRRNDLVKPNGLLVKEVWELRTALGAISCVDSFGVSPDGKNIFLIKRNTGHFAGKWCLVGGSVALNESLEDAVKRHWQADLGCQVSIPDWKKPIGAHQHMPRLPDGSMKKDFLEEPTKHSTGFLYAVTLLGEPQGFGSKEGGQEASEYGWFTLETLPSRDDFAYDFYDICDAFLTEANKK